MNQLNNLVAGRTAIGVASWVAPRQSGKLFGLDASRNPQAPYLARLFGVRDVALAAGLFASAGADRRRWLQLGVACDVLDAAAGYLAGRDGSLSRWSSTLVTSVALGAAAGGLAVLATDNAGEGL